MRIQIRLPAQPGERFTNEAAAAMVGQRPAFNVREHEGGPVLRDLGPATVVAAKVVEDGAAVLVTIDTGQPLDAGLDVSALSTMSFGFNAR